MRHFRWLCGVGTVGACAWSALASAHLDLISPVPREQGRFNVLEITNTNLKEGPCGQRENGRTDKQNVFTPGQTISVVWDEFIDHSSYYRVAFDRDGDDDFPTFSGPGIDSLGDDARDFCPVDGEVILAYEMNDRRGGRYTLDVTLPDVECDNCTLQVVQYMYGRGRQRPYYFQCADIVLQSVGDGPDAGGPDGGLSSDVSPPARDAGGTRFDFGVDAGNERSFQAAASCFQQLEPSPLPEAAPTVPPASAEEDVAPQAMLDGVGSAAEPVLSPPALPDPGGFEPESPSAAGGAGCACRIGQGNATESSTTRWGGLLVVVAGALLRRRARAARI